MSLSFEDLRSIISSGKKTQFAKAMSDVLKEKQYNLPDFYDLYGKLIREDTNFTMGESYIQFRWKYAEKILSLDKLMKMDRVLMENYALSKYEPIEFCFSGQIIRSFATAVITFSGIIYFTKLRVIGVGFTARRSMDPVTAVVGAVSPPASGALDKTFRSTMQKTLGDDFSETEFSKFDHIFPINKPYDIKRRKNVIDFTSDIEYEKKGKTKKKKLNLRIIPLKEKQEDKNAFETRKEELLQKIESFLLSF